MPRVPRLGHAATATAHSMRAPAGDQFRRTAATASVQQAPRTLSSTKGQGNSTPRALKRTQGCLRQKLSPPATPAATDQRGGLFLLRVPDHHNLRGRRFSMNHVEGLRTLQHVPQVILRVIARQGCPDAGIQGVPKDGAAGFPATTIRLQPMCGDSGRRPDRRK